MYAAHMRRISSAPDVSHVDTVPDERAFYTLFASFKRRQRRFHSSVPTFRGRPIDFYALYVAVVKHGGYSKVNDKDLWGDVAKEIKCPQGCVNYMVALRRIYSQYLLAFENEMLPHLKDDSLWSPFQDDYSDGGGDRYVPPSVEKMLGIVNPRPAPVNYGMHRSSSHAGFGGLRTYQELSKSSYDALPPSQLLEELNSRLHSDNMYDLRHLSVLETAEKSLTSGFPNEVDLSLNSILFLSAVVHPSPATPLRLGNTRNLLPLMLATVGLFEDGPSSLRSLTDSWALSSTLDFHKFWDDAVNQLTASCLKEDAFLYQEHSEPLVHDAEMTGYRVIPPPSPDSTHDLFHPSSSTFFLSSTSSSSESLSNYFLETKNRDSHESVTCLTRVQTVATVLVNCVTPPSVPGLPPPLEEDDDEIEQVMAFASSSAAAKRCSSSAIGRPFRGRSLFYAPGRMPPLAVWRENARFISSCPVAIRFAFLCAYARHTGLRQLGLQLVSSLRFPLTLPPAPTATVFPRPLTLHVNNFMGLELISVRFLIRCLVQSVDRCDLMSGLHLLTNLLRVPEGLNVESLFSSLPRCIWVRLIQLLCLSDLGLVCAVLETLYTATGMGALACTRLWRALAGADDTVSERSPNNVFTARRASIHLRPILALLSLEGQSMGTSSLRRVKVMQRHPQPMMAPLAQPSPVPLPYIARPQHHVPSQPLHHHPQHHSPSSYYPPHSPLQIARPYPPRCPPQIMPPQLPPLHQQQSGPPVNRSQMLTQPLPYHQPVPQQYRPDDSLARLLTQNGTSNESLPHRVAAPTTVAVVAPSTVTPNSVLHHHHQSPPPPPSQQLCVSPTWVANVKPEASSLSELTDRLQMPPPTAPPPRRTPSKYSPIGARPSVATPAMVNGKVSTPPQSPHMNHHIHHNSGQSHPSKSLLEEVLNASSNKAACQLSSPLLSPHPTSVVVATAHRMVNGTGGVGAGSTIHHPPIVGNRLKKEHQLSTEFSPSSKLVNGDLTPTKKSAVVQQNDFKLDQLPLTNGISREGEKENHEEAAFQSLSPPTPVKQIRKIDANDSIVENEDSDAEDTLLEEFSTFVGHVISYNRRVGFHFTKKRPRDFALRHRVIRDDVATTDSSSSSCPKERTKRRNFGVDDNQKCRVTQLSSPPPPPLPPPMLTCEWRTCRQQFTTQKQVCCHVYKTHLRPAPTPPKDGNASLPTERRCCQWVDCPSPHLPRAPFALVSHVLDYHCSPDQLKTRRQSIVPGAPLPPSALPPSGPLPPPPPQFLPPCVPDQSGMAVIRDVEARRLQSELWVSQMGVTGRYHLVPPRAPGGPPPPREGPVTKHLRVTAALILRNLAKHVQEARRWLLSETPTLCEIAMGTCPGTSNLRTNDAGRIITQCLAFCTAGSSTSTSLSYFNDEEYEDGEPEEPSLLQRLVSLQQRTSVDLDA